MKSEELVNLSEIEQQDNFNFSKHTTYGLGGIAKHAYFPKSEQDTIRIFEYLKSEQEKFVIIGNGSNILASDAYFDGNVICTIKLKGIASNDEYISCLAGTRTSELLKYCIEFGFSGLEFLIGIPASVGGLCYMNACAGGISISDVLYSVSVYDEKLRNLSNACCKFGYKHSTMRDINCVILSACFKVFRTDPKTVKNNISKFINARYKQPKGKSCGCVFKNINGVSAGKIIDKCGFKGLKIGGAEISRKHANFIISNGGTASDVYNLIQTVKKGVFHKTGIVLEEEVVYIGDF